MVNMLGFNDTLVKVNSLSDEDGLSLNSATPCSTEDNTFYFSSQNNNPYNVFQTSNLTSPFNNFGVFYPPMYYSPLHDYSPYSSSVNMSPDGNHLSNGIFSDRMNDSSIYSEDTNYISKDTDEKFTYNETKSKYFDFQSPNLNDNSNKPKTPVTQENEKEMTCNNLNILDASLFPRNDNPHVFAPSPIKHKKRLSKEKDYSKKRHHNKDRKRCSNCLTTQSPSWRRSTSNFSKGNLLCNACGLYEKTTRRKRMLLTQDDGATKVVRKRDIKRYCCSICGVQDATRWKRLNGLIQCYECTRSQK